MNFKNLKKLIKRLEIQEDGEAYEAFRESILGDIIDRGYSAKNAEEILEDLIKQEMRNLTF